MLRHDNMAIAIRGRPPNRTANVAADDDRRPQGDPTSEYENRDNTGPHRRSRPRNRNRSTGSESNGRANRSTRNRDRSKKRYRQDSPTQTRRGRGWTTYRQQRLLQITESIACVPTQNIKKSDERFKNMTHSVLPIRSVEENCSHVNQLRRWINDRPTRGTQMADDMLKWVLHFEESKEVQQFTLKQKASKSPAGGDISASR